MEINAKQFSFGKNETIDFKMGCTRSLSIHLSLKLHLAEAFHSISKPSDFIFGGTKDSK